MELVAFSILLLTLVITVSSSGLFYAVYLLLKRITAIPVDFKLPDNVPILPPVGNGQPPAANDAYTPESADRTVSLENFKPNDKKPLKVIYEEKDQITPQEEDAKD